MTGTRCACTCTNSTCSGSKEAQQGSQMFSRKKQSKMTVLKDSNNNAVEESVPHFCFNYDLDRNEKLVGHFLDT